LYIFASLIFGISPIDVNVLVHSKLQDLTY